ncbi:MAG: hypothetical protein LBJ48_01295, partial [Coriobacteriales bacterium]|nr:hypothetical protein [Coriobacteriales bacterium]
MHVRSSTPVLFIITGIALIVLGLISAAESLTSIVNFLALYSSMSAYLSLNVFPWPQTVFSIITGVVMLVTGILAIVFARKPQKSTPVLILAAASGVLALIELAMQLFRNIGMLVNYGGD